MFEKSLQDLVKGIRSHKRDPSAFISQSIQEIKQELRSTDPFVKAQAVRKLTYLQMMGYDMSWASFSVVEVMSSSRFAHKRIGYLAACQTFTDTTDVVLLTTNLLKKEFLSPNQYEVGIAVNCLANIVTKDLARDLIGDVVSLIGHSKPYVRKKSVLSLYKIYIKYPQGLRLTFDKLKEKLEDAESAVVSCAVNVICELANKNPKNYLAMAPKFFRLLTTSSNNWMLIKVVKLLGSLVPEEPRLARKLLEPLATIIQNTAAKSLLYECIHTVTLALPFAKKADGSDSRNVQAVVNLCGEHLRQFVEDSDQNLKYLGLVGFVNLMKSYPRAVVDHKELVLACLSDDDVTIRMKALELLTGMVTKRNLTELVHKLMQHALLAEGQYRDEIIAKIIFMCSRDKYAYLSDIPWYVSVLVDLSYIQGPVHGSLVAAQLIDVSVRAEAVREYAVKCMLGLLLDANLFMGQSQTTVANVLYAAGWIVGEYADHLAKIDGDLLPSSTHHGGEQQPQPDDQPPQIADGGEGGGLFCRVLQAYLDPRATNLPETVQVVYMQNAVKVLSAACRHVASDAALERIIGLVRDRLLIFMQSVHVEVQERATTFRNLLVALGILAPERHKAAGSTQAPPAVSDTLNLLMSEAHEASGGVSAARLNQHVLAALTGEQLQPVNPKAQKKVPMPPGLDLDAPLDPHAFEQLLDYQQGFPKTADLSSVCFTHIYIAAPEPDDDVAAADVIFSSDSRGSSVLAGQGGGSAGASPRPQHSDEFSGYQVTSAYEAHKAKWQATPFYLSNNPPSGTTAAVHPDDVDIDSIPMVRLTTADLEGRGGGGKNKKGAGKKGHRKQQPGGSSSSGSLVMPVLKDDVMPEGAKDSDDEDDHQAGDRRRGGKASKGGKGRSGGKAGGGHGSSLLGEEDVDLKDVDITTPLRPDELMPRMEHRATAPTTARPSPQKAGADQQASPSVKGDRQQHRSKKGGKSSKSSSSSGRQAAPAPSEAPLIDLDDFMGGPLPSSSTGGAASSRSQAASKASSAVAMDLLNFGDDDQQQQADAPTPPRHPDPAPRTPQRPPGGSLMDDYLGLDSPLVATASSSMAASSSQHRGGSAKSRRTGGAGTESKTTKTKKKSSSSKEDKAQPQPHHPTTNGASHGSSSNGGGTAAAPKPCRLVVVRSKAVKVEVSVLVEHGLVTLQLRVKNNTSGPLSDVSLVVDGLTARGLAPAHGGSLQPVPGAKDAWQVSRSIGEGQTAKGSITLAAAQPMPDSSISLPAAIRYSTGSLLDGASQVDGRLLVPVSAFLQPGPPLSASAFASLLGSGSRDWTDGQIRLSCRKGLESAVEHVASLFRAQVVELHPPAASLYATTPTQDHVAVLVKEGSGELLLSVKASGKVPVSQLLQDAQAALPSL